MIHKLVVALTLLTLTIFAPIYRSSGDVALAQGAQQSGAQDVVYACPMHAEVTSKSAGRCPKCNMELRVRSAEDWTNMDGAGGSAAGAARKGANDSSTDRAESSGQQTATQSPASKPANSEAAAKYFSNTILLTQDNKPVRFYDDLLKGKVVLINFIFTTCKGVCLPMTANLAKVQKYLGERVGSDVLMISISVDPETDTPAALKKYADTFKAQPGWYFLTGEKKNVDWVLYKLGGYVAEKGQHTSTLIIGNVGTGEWMKVPAMSNPTEIASAATKLLSAN